MNKTDAFGYEIEIGRIYSYVNIKESTSFILKAESFLKSQVRFTILQQTQKSGEVWDGEKLKYLPNERIGYSAQYGKTKALNAHCVTPVGVDIIQTDYDEKFDVDEWYKGFSRKYRYNGRSY